MSSYFTLELITSPPSLSIYLPSFVPKDSPTPFVIESDRELSPNKTLEIKDSLGNIHPISLAHDYNKFVGEYSFSECSYGIATITATVVDTVGNISEVETKVINILSQYDANIQKMFFTIDTPRILTMTTEPIILKTLDTPRIQIKSNP